jgi:hypothetical protein
VEESTLRGRLTRNTTLLAGTHPLRRATGPTARTARTKCPQTARFSLEKLQALPPPLTWQPGPWTMRWWTNYVLCPGCKELFSRWLHYTLAAALLPPVIGRLRECDACSSCYGVYMGRCSRVKAWRTNGAWLGHNTFGGAPHVHTNLLSSRKAVFSSKVGTPNLEQYMSRSTVVFSFVFGKNYSNFD